jgi:hypothetical protein
MKIFEYCLDGLFGIDILINFLSAFENPDGSLEPRISKIAMNYLKFWFLVDIFAVIPVQLFELGNTNDADISPPDFMGFTTTGNLTMAQNNTLDLIAENAYNQAK